MSLEKIHPLGGVLLTANEEMGTCEGCGKPVSRGHGTYVFGKYLVHGGSRECTDMALAKAAERLGNNIP